ncbi:unnamed protein product [Vicia faba]|uniref:Uncharacterized protein n=1 Tax=Vicia faba TaxID=3906 RepID=A0AAV0YG53_VICFA|nr:unnamed protein product [Vicia faba]
MYFSLFKSYKTTLTTKQKDKRKLQLSMFLLHPYESISRQIHKLIYSVIYYLNKILIHPTQHRPRDREKEKRITSHVQIRLQWRMVYGEADWVAVEDGGCGNKDMVDRGIRICR